MAQPTNTHDTYDNIGTREDLQDKIYQVTPETTPVYSSIRRLTAKNTLHEWQRDHLDTPNKDNAVVEGDDRTGQAITPTERIGNYTQLFDKAVTVATTVDTVVKAGRGSEMKYQEAKKMVEVKRDKEASLLSNNVAAAGDGATNPRKSAGLGAMIYTNVSHGTGGSTPVHTAGAQTVAPTAGTPRAFTEDLVKDVMQSAATESSDLPSLMCLTPAHKGAFSTNFTGIAANRYQVGKSQQGRIIGGADIYMSDFGEIMVVPNYVHSYAAEDTAYILNPEHAGWATRQRFKSEELGKTGHSDKKLISTEGCLVVTNEKAHCKIADLTQDGL